MFLMVHPSEQMQVEHVVSITHNRVCYFGCLKGVSKSVQVLFNGTDAVLVRTVLILK